MTEVYSVWAHGPLGYLTEESAPMCTLALLVRASVPNIDRV